MLIWSEDPYFFFSFFKVSYLLNAGRTNTVEAKVSCEGRVGECKEERRDDKDKTKQ